MFRFNNIINMFKTNNVANILYDSFYNKNTCKQVNVNRYISNESFNESSNESFNESSQSLNKSSQSSNFDQVAEFTTFTDSLSKEEDDGLCNDPSSTCKCNKRYDAKSIRQSKPNRKYYKHYINYSRK